MSINNTNSRMRNNSLSSLLMTTRPSFLILTPACIFLGVSIVIYLKLPINYFLLLIIAIGAISAHVSVNMLNEYIDFKSGLDLQTIKTAFSGGSGALPANPEAASLTLIMGLITLTLTVLIGIYLLLTKGSLIFPIGIAGIVLIITYTQWLNKHPLLCLLAPGLGFGVLMVVGTYVVLADQYAQLAWLLSIPPFLLINNLLLLNQYPDIDADANIGRRTLPIVYGITISNLIYALFTVSSYTLIVYYVLNDYMPSLSLIALLSVLFSIYAGYGALKHGAQVGLFPRYMAANVAACLLTPCLLGIGLILGQ
jgi:1,4-dihydroxy-2-naphthoate polyprenyltransferase